MRRRQLLQLFPALALAQKAGNGPLKITGIEGIVIRTPNDEAAAESLIEMPPVGAVTGGIGLGNRLDHASPSRFKGRTQAVLVKITTSQGLTGWGECHAPAAPRMHERIISDALAPLLVGLDARNVEALWDRMYSSERLRGYSTGPFLEAIAGIDLALWDLLGKFTGQPVYQLLGGKYRDSIPTYIGLGGATAEQLRANAAKALAAGFTTMKMGLSKGAGTRDTERAAVAAEAIRGKGQLLVDSLGGYKFHEAVTVGRELDRMKAIGWWEDALMPEETVAYPEAGRCFGRGDLRGRDLFEPVSVPGFVCGARGGDHQSGHLPGGGGDGVPADCGAGRCAWGVVVAACEHGDGALLERVGAHGGGDVELRDYGGRQPDGGGVWECAVEEAGGVYAGVGRAAGGAGVWD
ncbi:MAG: hypothetical protein IPJ98_03750 [Bryobacterales bacterium]|nr:hypothetical protein [Bryobacterales bacterium]